MPGVPPDVGTCVEPFISRTGLALTKPVLPTPEDLPYLLSSWHGRLDAHGHDNSLAAGFVCTPSVALALLRIPLSGRTVLASFDGCGLSFLSAHVFLFVPSARWFIFWVSEDLHFLKFSPVDIAKVSSVLALHRLGLWLGGFSAPAFQLVQSHPISILFRVCLPECLFSMSGPEDVFCKNVSWKRGLLATPVGEASHLGPAATADDSAHQMDILGTPASFPGVS